jgi:hypothetical protein
MLPCAEIGSLKSISRLYKIILAQCQHSENKSTGLPIGTRNLRSAKIPRL